MFYGILHLDFYFCDVQHPGEEIAGHVQITGAYLQTSPGCAFDDQRRLCPVIPEPASLCLLIAGAGVLLSLVVARRRAA